MGSVCRFCGASNEEKRTTCSSCQRPVAADPSSFVGQTVGNHQVLRLVGEGPIGMVFEAVHTPSGGRARLKIIDSDLLATEPSLAEDAGQLVVGSTGLHDGLPELVEISLERPPVRFVSVKWCDGQTLRDLLAGGPLAPDEACRIGAGVLSALDALHGAGLAHRDLKPENVLVAPPGGAADVFILDVGPSVISARAAVGASFRSPEQARGSDNTGPATDLYACGAMLYEALSGRRPFEASDYDVLMSQISLRRPPPLGQLCPHLTPAFVQVIVRAMAPMPGERFRSAVEMRDALQEAAAAARPRAPEPEPQRAAPPAAAAQPAQPPRASGSMVARPDLLPKPPAAASPDAFDVEVEAPTIRRPGLPEAEDLQPQRASGTSKVVRLFVVFAAFALGGVLLWALLHMSQQAETRRVETPIAPTPTPPPDPDADMVRIRLSGLPTGAVWYDNDKRLSANPFRVRKGRAVHTIKVEAPGYATYETRLSFGGDQELQIVMTPLPDAGPAEPFQFKAFTSGPGANVRVPRKGPSRPSITPIKAPEASPDALREHNASTPGRTTPQAPAPPSAPQPLLQ